MIKPVHLLLVRKGNSLFMRLKPQLFLTLIVLAFAGNVKAQDTTLTQVMTGIDTTAFYDSIMAELRALGLVGGERRSFLNVNASIGNGSFALQNNNFKVRTDHVFYNTGIGYYHKSGLSFSSGFNFTNDQGTFKLFQVFLAPSYDYQNKNVALGITGFKYFNQKNLSFYVSPLVNELYTYVVVKKWWLQPKLALDYAWGTYDELAGIKSIDTMRYRRFAPIVRYLSKQNSMAAVSDFSLILTLRHDFVVMPKAYSRRFFRYTPAVTLLAGTSTYGTNTPMNSLSGPRLATNPTVQLFRSIYESSLQPLESKFRFQNFNITQSAAYYFNKMYVQGQLVFSYIMPAAQSKWNVFYNIGAGINL